MRILIAGASGLIGSALKVKLPEHGHAIIPLVRGNAPGVRWDPLAGTLDPTALVNIDAIIHLSGEGVASGRWTAAKKRAIRDSRVLSTQLLSRAIQESETPPKVWLCASAIGYYGDRGDDTMSEASPPGTGFLAEVCKEWEAATHPAVESGVRVVNLRFGVVLDARGGALKTMMAAFKLGLGGVIGDGKQFISWIALEDAAAAILHVLQLETYAGPVNIVSPNPVRNAELTQALGAVLHRPTLLPMPTFAARLVFGEMADEMFLASTRVEPKKLREGGFQFRWPDLIPALEHIVRA